MIMISPEVLKNKQIFLKLSFNTTKIFVFFSNTRYIQNIKVYKLSLSHKFF